MSKEASQHSGGPRVPFTGQHANRRGTVIYMLEMLLNFLKCLQALAQARTITLVEQLKSVTKALRPEPEFVKRGSGPIPRHESLRRQKVLRRHLRQHSPRVFGRAFRRIPFNFLPF